MVEPEKDLGAILREALLKAAEEKGTALETSECIFPYDDVPNFLKRLYDFQERSSQSKIIVSAYLY